MLSPTCGVNGKGQILTPMTSKSLKFFEFELDILDYVLECTSADFHFNPFGGSSAQIGEILRFSDFLVSWLYCIFFLGRKFEFLTNAIIPEANLQKV